MLDAAYDFVDPGVYAEDENVNWSIDSGFPDWDGDGIGECYEFVKVTDRTEMESCTYQGVPTYLKIHVYSVLQTTTLQQMQNTLTGGYGFTSSPKVPKTDNLDPVDGSISKNQGIRFLMEDGSRVIFRLSGTAGSGATVRMYIEKYVPPTGSLHEVCANVVGDLVKAALELSSLVKFTGMESPTVIT